MEDTGSSGVPKSYHRWRTSASPPQLPAPMDSVSNYRAAAVVPCGTASAPGLDGVGHTPGPHPRRQEAGQDSGCGMGGPGHSGSIPRPLHYPQKIIGVVLRLWTPPCHPQSPQDTGSFQALPCHPKTQAMDTAGRTQSRKEGWGGLMHTGDPKSRSLGPMCTALSHTELESSQQTLCSCLPRQVQDKVPMNNGTLERDTNTGGGASV